MTATAHPPVHDDASATVALEAALDRLFYAHGVAGVTVEAIRDASGVSLRRIYRLCPSKSDLISLWLRHRHDTWTADFELRMEASLAAGTDPVNAVFDAIESWMVDTEFRGCGFINTHAEVNELTAEHLDIIQNHKRALSQQLDTRTGSGPALAVLVDGAIVQAAMFRSTDPIDNARAAALALTEQDA